MAETKHNETDEIKPAIGWGTWIVLHIITIPLVVYLGSVFANWY